MTRTRLEAHTWTLTTLGLIAAATWTATQASWWCIPALPGAATTAALAAGTYLRANREQRITQQLAQLRTRPVPPATPLTRTERRAFARIVRASRKPDPAYQLRLLARLLDEDLPPACDRCGRRIFDTTTHQPCTPRNQP